MLLKKRHSRNLKFKDAKFSSKLKIDSTVNILIKNNSHLKG